MKYDFETLVKRKGVGSGKWEGMYKANPEVGEDVVPFSVAGFEKENKQKILKKYPTADYMICRVTCSSEQKSAIYAVLQEDYQKRFRYHYAVLGLPFILLQKPFQQKNCYTCSSYLAQLLENAGIWHWKKHISLVTPKDFYCDLEKEIIFEGRLHTLCSITQTAAA